MKSMITLLSAFAAAPLTQASVLTGPIVNPANGHSYYLLEQDTWTNSEAFAQTLGGHLVTINDAAENQWVFDTFANFDSVSRNLWIGLSDQASESDFVWSSGEASAFTDWANNQPDNASVNGPDQDFVYIISPNSIFIPNSQGEWDDVSPLDTSLQSDGFHGVVEVVPEPSTALLALGGLTLTLRRRRKD